MTAHAPYWPLATLLAGMLLGGIEERDQARTQAIELRIDAEADGIWVFPWDAADG